MYRYKFNILLASLLFGLLFTAKVSKAQLCYADFKNTYKPTNIRNDTANKAVCLVGCMSEDAAATLLEEYIENNDSKMFTLIITSLDRKKAGAVIDKMDRNMAIRGLKMLSAEWVYEIVYYVSERTYKYVDNRLTALEKYSMR